MSLSSGIDQNNNDANLRGRFYPDLIPWEADPRGDMTLGAVLQNGNSASNPDTGLPQDATDFKILGCETIFTGEVFQGNNASVKIGDALDTLQIKGGTALGSMLVGNGLNTEELVCPTTNTNATTGTIYNWLSLANGQSRDFFVSDGTLYQLGYSITIVYSGTDSITGTITAVAGNLITITIVSFTSAVYNPSTLITTTPPDPTTATSGGGDPVFIFNPAVSTPATIPNNSFLLTGLCYLYGAPPVVGSSNISLTAQASPPAINGTTSIFSIPQYENPPVSTSAFSWGTAGCFIPDGTSVSLASNTGGNQIAFAFPLGGSFIDQNFTGSVSGYSLAYTPNGVITINSKLVLTADNTKPLGVFWGVDAQGVGTVTSVSAGTNINISGSLSAPVVNFATPTTSNIQLGVGTELLATAGNTTMSIDSTGLTDTYSSGGVVNLEDIAVSSTNVVQTLSTTDGSNYSNSSVLTCNQSGITDQKTATENVSNYSGGAGISCFPTATSISCGITYPTSPPFPNADGNISIGVSSGGGSLTPSLSLTASAPFQPSYSTILDKDGILQNNSSGNGFRCRSAQDIYLEPTNGLPNPQIGVIRIPNGNSINMSVDTYTTTYRKDGMGVSDVSPLSASVAVCDLTATGGNSQMFLGSTNIGTSSHTLRAEVPLVGNALITHETVSGAVRNLTISSQGAIGITTNGGIIDLSSTGGINMNAGQIGSNVNPVVISNSGVGGQSNPTLTLNNSNATGSVALEVYKNKPTAGSSGDVLFTQSVYGKDGANNKQEYTRITHTIRANTSGVEEGSIEMGAFADGAYSTFIQINGNDNPSGEVNILRPLDFIGGSDANSTIKTSGTGSVNLNLDASTSAGAGGIVLKTKNSTGSIAITGDQITTVTAGANTGRHLRIFLPNGAGVLTPYKINLFADT